MEKTKYQILDLLQKYGIPYAQKGKSFVARCPFCKRDGKLQNHNAEINVDTATLYCFSEQKTYFVKDLLLLFDEINPAQIEKAKEKIKRDAEHNTGLARATQKRRKFDDLKNDLLQKGYMVTGIYEYRNLAGQKEYEVIRFEKPSRDGGKPEKIPIPVADGYAGLGNKRQIPYRLEQFLVIQSDEIWLCEGEKCTDSVIAAMPSSANIICLGFRKASDFKGFENLFQGKKVVIFEDNDKTGNQNAQNLVEMLKPFAREITVVKFTEFIEGYDVADYIEDFGWNQLIERIFLSEKIVKEDIARKIQEAKAIYAENLIYGKYADEKWLCKELIYTNSVCLLDAAGAAGKSFLALQLAVSYILQPYFLLPELQWSRKNRKVMYITTQLENPPEIVTNRLIQICSLYNFDQLDREMIYENIDISYLDALFLPNPEDQLPKETETYAKLAEHITNNDIQLVILDPISLFFLVNMNDNEKIPVIYRKLQETGATWILIHHQSKATMFEEPENTSQRGASALRDNARLRLTMKRRVILHMGTIAMDMFVEKANFSKFNQHHIFLTPKPPFSVISTTIWDHEKFMQMENEIKKGEKERKKRKGNGNGHTILNENF
jgi:RecA-family ATPase